MDELSGESANPMDAVFERAVRPFASTDALRAEFPHSTPVIIMRRAQDVPTETREVEGGGTITVPVLAALKDASVASRSTLGAYDFATMEPDAVALLLPKTPGKEADVRIVTKAAGGALLVADLEGMLTAVVSLADHPALKAFPGGEFLVDALRTGLTQAKDELLATLTKPGASGTSLIDEIAEAAPRAKARAAKTKEGAGKARGKKTRKK